MATRDSGLGSDSAYTLATTTTLVVQTPIYRGGVVPAMVAARRAAFVGWLGMSAAPKFVLDSALEGCPGTVLQSHYRAGASDTTFTAGRASRAARWRRARANTEFGAKASSLSTPYCTTART